MTVEAIRDFGSPNPPREFLDSCLALDIILLETADILLVAGAEAAGEGVLDGVVTVSLVSLSFPSSMTFNFSYGYTYLNHTAFIFTDLAVLNDSS